MTPTPTIPWVSFGPFIFLFFVMLIALRAGRSEAAPASTRRRGRGIGVAVALAVTMVGLMAAIGSLRVSRSVSPASVSMSARLKSSSHSAPKMIMPRQPQIPPAPAVPSPGESHVAVIDGEQHLSIDVRTEATQSTPTETEKPWVHGWAQFVNATGIHGLVVESTGTSPTQDNARDEAIDVASRDVQGLLWSRADVRQAFKFRGDQDLLRALVTNDLRSGNLVADEYTLATPRPYGTIWKHYLLIDTSASKLDPIVDDFMQAASMRQGRQWTAAGSLAALSGVIILTYLFLNAATKGYFVWRLRATALLVVIVAVLVVLAVV